jgi:hypothetical protein
VQQRAVLEEIQMPPGLLLRVMNRAALAPALRAGEPAPPRKIQYRSSRPSTASNSLRVTIHGDERPRANWKRSVSCIPSN